ncbi:MAG: hypothetical protein KIS76_16545 [Pyrinomonadaceae bacterium]|nr:hypothetical protein [Pyrinomonadaceae bacterium]
MLKITATFLLFVFLLSVAACSRSEDSSIFALSDDTNEAVKLVDSANQDLKDIKKLYKANENRVEDLKIAMKEKKVEEAKKIANDAVYAINDGMALGIKAVEKIEKAKNLNINNNFKDYLDLKEKSLRKLMEAFELRRQIALALRNGYDPENVEQRDVVMAEFKEKDEQFKKLEKEAQEASRKANQLAKDASQSDS